MSLLNELLKKKNKLKQVETVVTQIDGSKYIEGGNIVRKLSTRTYGFVVDTKPDVVPACIIDNFLYLGSQDSVDVENIVKYKLTHILSVGIETPIDLGKDISCKYIPCLDLPETNLYNVCSIANEYISNVLKKGGRVLVHCNAGVSRSASVIIGYLMNNRNYSFEDAYNLVKAKRECIQPNRGFIEQLKNF